MRKTTIKKLHELFYSRRDVYAECFYSKKDKRYVYKSIKKSFTESILDKHINDPNYSGIGIYPLLEGNKTKWISADFDFHSAEEQEEALKAVETMTRVADDIGLHFYKEISKSGAGMHIWVFFDEEIESWKARKLMGGFLLACKCDSLSSMDRFFPSQDRLFETSKGFGNLIHMPFSAYFIKTGTYFEINDGKIDNSEDAIEMFLAEVVQHKQSYVDTILDKWNLLTSVDTSSVYEQDNIEYEYAEDGLLSVLEDPFIKWCSNNPQMVDYNAWIGMITNLLPFGNDGVKAIHNISSKDMNRYDKQAVSRKILACEGFKPITYNWIIKNSNFKEKVNVAYKSPAVAGIKSKAIESLVYENYGRYFIVGSQRKGDKELSTWTAEPIRIVRIGEQISRVWNIVAEDKIIKDVSFDAGDLSSLPAFKRKIMSLYHKILWYGTETELMRVLDYLNQHYPKLPNVSGTDQIGMIQDPLSKNWLVLTQHQCWDKDSVREDFIYFNPSVKKEITFSNSCEITKNECANILSKLFSFNDLRVCATIIGWCCSIFIKQRLYELHSVRFPVLMIHGQAGSGKSETARHIVQPFFGDISPMLRVDDITNFAFTALGSSTNMFPLVYDEYKPALFDNSKIKMISKMIRGLYDNETSMRGQKDLSTKEFKVFAPAVVIGESGFEEPALRERSSDVFFSKQESVKFVDNFTALSKMGLSKLGNALLNWSLSLDDNELFNMFKSNIKGGGRVLHNLAMINTGLDLLSKFYDSKGLALPTDGLKSEVEKYQMDAITISGETRSAVDNILEAVFVMEQSGLITADKMEIDREKKEVYLHTPTIYPLFKKWARDTMFDKEIISHDEFVKQVKKMDYYDGIRNMRIGEDGEKVQRKVRVFDFQLLANKGIVEC